LLVLLVRRAERAYLARLARSSSRASIPCSSCSLVEQSEHAGSRILCHAWAHFLYWYVPARLVTLSPPSPSFRPGSILCPMPPRKTNDRNSSKRKEDLLNSVGPLSLAMRPCKRCSSLGKTCSLGEASEKCICCVEAGKPCDLAIPPAKLRRIHNERLRVRDAVREVEAKLYRLKHQLRQLENEEEVMVLSEWSVIDTLEDKEKASLPKAPELPFDVFSEQFQFSDSLDWSPLAAGPLDLGGTSE
jgi:hypothetical protein